MSNNLVVATVGDDSVHLSWINQPDKKNFDLFLIYYGKEIDKFYPDCDFYKQDKGYKFPLLYKHLSNSVSTELYDYFWFPDDDIETTTKDINKMFEMMNNLGYWIAQPSLKKGCPHTWPHTTTRFDKNIWYRNTSFIEIMCPIFTRDALQHFLPIFKETHTGWGLDRLWSRDTLKLKHTLGILDAVIVDHRRKMGSGDLYQNLKKDGIDYKKEYQNFLKQFNLTHVKQQEKVNWW